MKKLQKVDEISLPNHYYLSNDDECYFILSYTSNKDFKYSDENSLISNLKKDVSKKGTPEYKYKEDAINKCAKYLRELNIPEVFSDNITLVPIPPSKTKDDPQYDDRLMQILSSAFNEDIDIKELIIQGKSTEATHKSEERLKPDDIKNNYKIDNDIKDDVKDTIILFDDMLTTGAHFIAAKGLINEELPDKKVKGIFIARRIFEKKEENNNFEAVKLSLDLNRK